MNLTLRRGAATVAMSALLLAPLTLSPAGADELPTCDDPAAVAAALDSAQSDAVAAEEAFTAYQRSISALLKAERDEVKALARAARDALEDATRAAKDAATKEERKAALAAIKEQRKALAAATKLLRSDRSLREQVRAEREAAKLTWKQAKQALETVEALAESCEDVNEPEPEPEPLP